MKKIDFKKIIENYYYEDYKRPLKYIDPRNVSKNSDTYLLNEHNQTVSFYNAVQKYYAEEHEVVAWFELSVGKNPPKKDGGRESTNAIDAIIYIIGLDTLFIVEAKGLRKESKFHAILNDFNRTIGEKRTKEPNDYIIQMKNRLRFMLLHLQIYGAKKQIAVAINGLSISKTPI